MSEFTPAALAALDAQIVAAEEDLAAAQLSMGSSAEDGNNTWHDNPAFDQAKQDVDRAEAELRRLRGLRRDAVVVEATESGLVEVGSTVVIKFTNDDEPMTIFMAGPYATSSVQTEKDVMAMSTTAPLGAALLGHATNDVVSYVAPNGKTMEVTILELT